jgi:tetratricopeptide (TPR) repeat protein
VRWTATLAAAALLALPAAVPGSPPVAGRAQALTALGDAGNAEARRAGARALAEKGTMEDVPALAQALRDPDATVRGLAERAMWEVWSRSGDAEVDRLFAAGVLEMSERRTEAAVATFTRIIARAPDFAEGWNKRATAYYLLGDYARSLADCHEVVKRNPHHFGALSGFGMIYVQLDQPARALEYFERALAVNPNLRGVDEAVEALRTLVHRPRPGTI